MLTQRTIAIVIWCVIVVSISSCSGDENKRTGKIHHPTNENIPESTIAIGSNKKVSQLSYKFLLNIGKQTPLSLVGDDAKNSKELLGVIESIEITEAGEILVLDSKDNKLKAYSIDGRLISDFGRTGDGPGEFRRPEVMVLAVENHVIVADRFNKIHRYRYHDQVFEYVDSITLDYVPVDMCALSDKLIVRGIRHSKKGFESVTILHSYSLENLGHVNSFGRSYHSKNGLIINQLSDGPIACDITTNSIIAMFEYLPFIYSYNENGNIKWIAELEDFRALSITENYSGSVTFSPGKDGVKEVGKSIIKITDSLMILQTRAEVNESVYYKSYVFNSNDGTGKYIGQDVPRIYDITGEYIVSESPSELPSFQVFKQIIISSIK